MGAAADLTYMDDDITERWFTGAADGLIPKTFTPLEQDKLIEIITFARDPANQDRELLHCIDGDGTAVIDSSTGHKSAPVTDEMKLAAVNGPVRFWHNHPSRDSVSHSDWDLAGTSPTIEIFAVNAAGSSFAGRMMDWPAGMEELIKQFVTISAVVERRMENGLRAAGVDIDDIVTFSHRTGHVMNLAMAACDLVEYAHRLMPADEANWELAESTGVVAMGLSLATAQIKGVLAAAATAATTSATTPAASASPPLPSA